MTNLKMSIRRIKTGDLILPQKGRGHMYLDDEEDKNASNPILWPRDHCGLVIKTENMMMDDYNTPGTTAITVLMQNGIGWCLESEVNLIQSLRNMKKE